MIVFALFCVQLLITSVMPLPIHAKKTHSAALIKDAGGKFAELLSSVIKINEMRLQAMKHLTMLEEQTIPFNNDLRMSSDNDNFKDEDGRPPIILILLGQGSLASYLKNLFANKHLPIPYQTDWNSKQSDRGTNGSEELRDRQSRDTRRLGEFFCAKTASKACRKSCVDAFKLSCSVYRCPRRMRKKARSLCRSSCAQEFRTSRYADIYME